MIHPDEALEIIKENTPLKSPAAVPLKDALGSVLAEPVLSDRDYPPFDRAMMDGVAVRTCDAGKCVRVVGEVPAGSDTDEEVRPGQCLQIMTGAACPRGTEAVVKVEEIERHGNEVKLPERIDPEQNIDLRGREARSGGVVMEKGETVTPLAVGLLATVGANRVTVYPMPSLAKISTGGELAPPGEEPGPHQIRDANGPMLEALAAMSGIPEVTRLHAQDTEASLREILDRAGDKDIILLSGGVSAGKYDLVPEQVEAYGAKILFHKVRQKPGKPLLFARRGSQLIFGMPGNPLAVHLCYHRYVEPAIRIMTGHDAGNASLKGILAAPYKTKGKRYKFILANAVKVEGVWEVEPFKRVGSADLFSTAKANCYARFSPGSDEMEKGHPVEFTRL